MLILLLLLFWPASLLADLTLHYEIFYGPLKLGESKIIITPKEYKAIAYTTGIGNTLYPYQAEWVTIINEKGYPLKAVISSKDRFKERKKIILFDQANHTVTIEKVLPKPKKKNLQLPFPLFDELSAFVYAWNLNYSNQKEFQLPLYIDEERHFTKVTYKNHTTCKFGNQSEACLEIEVLLPEKSELLKRSRLVTLFLSQKRNLPLELRGKLPLFGSLRAELKGIYP